MRTTIAVATCMDMDAAMADIITAGTTTGIKRIITRNTITIGITTFTMNVMDIVIVIMIAVATIHTGATIIGVEIIDMAIVDTANLYNIDAMF